MNTQAQLLNKWRQEPKFARAYDALAARFVALNQPVPFDEIIELREDVHDLQVVIERRDEPTTSQAELLAELKRDNLL